MSTCGTTAATSQPSGRPRRALPALPAGLSDEPSTDKPRSSNGNERHPDTGRLPRLTSAPGGDREPATWPASLSCPRSPHQNCPWGSATCLTPASHPHRKGGAVRGCQTPLAGLCLPLALTTGSRHCSTGGSGRGWPEMHLREVALLVGRNTVVSDSWIQVDFPEPQGDCAGRAAPGRPAAAGPGWGRGAKPDANPPSPTCVPELLTWGGPGVSRL